MDQPFEQYLTEEQQQVWHGLTSPFKIQTFLDSIPYSAEDINRTPLQVLQDRTAHCLDGALFAAAALQKLGYSPVLVDILPDPGVDDDHVLAVFKRHGRVGALAKSNFTNLRFREPVYRSIRELVMSYFDVFFNVKGLKTMRAYTLPLKVKSFNRINWLTNMKAPYEIERRFLKLRQVPVITGEMAAELNLADPLSLKAGTLATNPAGLFKPKGG